MDECEDIGLRLGAKSKNDDSCILARRFDSDMGKVKVQSDKGEFLYLADTRHSRVEFTNQLLIENRHRVVHIRTQKFCHIDWQSLVNPETYQSVPDYSATTRSHVSSAA